MNQHNEKITTETRAASLKKTEKKADKRRVLILSILGNREMTAHEITEELLAGGHIDYYDPNFARPRLTELLQDGEVITVGKRKCGRTGKTVAVWKRNIQNDNENKVD